MKHSVLKPEKTGPALFAKSLCGCLLVASGSLALATGALAQTVTYSGEMNIPYGHSYSDQNRPYDPSTRTADGNRLIINGRIVTGDGSSLPGTIGGDFFGQQTGFGSSGAIGNQLNVVTVGNWNTVIIDSTQINNGNQTVNIDGASSSFDPPIADSNMETGELNGEINLDD